MLMFNSRRSIRHLKRYSEIVSIFARHGFGFLFKRSEPGLRTWVRFSGRTSQMDVPPQIDNLAVHFRQALEEAGPTFVKFGQILSTRPDLLPHRTEQIGGFSLPGAMGEDACGSDP